MVRFRRNKGMLPYIVVPVVFIIFILGMYLIAGRNMWNLFISDLKIAAMKGAPKYSYVNMQPEDKKKPKEEKVEGEVKYPLYGVRFGEMECVETVWKAPVYYGDSEEILKKGIGVFAGSKIPGEKGTILVGGDNQTFMEPIKDLKKGNRITFTTTYGEYLYEVSDMKVADVVDDSVYKLPGDKEELILYTNYPFSDRISRQMKRYYVYAKKVTDATNQGGE